MIKYVGIGDLILDIYYDKDTTLLGYYPGGSMLNDLINLKHMKNDVDCGCIITAGCDWASEYILGKLREFGVDVKAVKRAAKPTKRINVLIDMDGSKSQLKCPKCGNKIWYSDARLPQINHEGYLLKNNELGIVIIDNIKRNTLDTAHELNKVGWKIALDLGHISHLRYMNFDNVNELFSFQIDYLQTNSHVIESLKEKLGLKTNEDLFIRLGCIYLNITDGSKGSKLYYLDSGIVKVSLCPSMNTVIRDTTGAGDAFFSSLLINIGDDGLFEKSVVEVQQFALRVATDRINVVGALGKIDQFPITNSSCMFCGKSSSLERKKKGLKETTTEKNVSRLLDRTLGALQTNTGKQIHQILSIISGTVFTVGTGGSFAAAVYVAKYINNMYSSAYASPKHPRDVLIEGIEHASIVFLFSYSGRTRDIQNVYYLCKANGKKVYIVTMMDKSTSIKYYCAEDTISYCGSANDSKERGFISIARTIIPVSLFVNSFYEPKDDFAKFIIERYNHWSTFFSELTIDWSYFFNNPIIHIFSGVDTVSACTDLESKITESGIGIVVTHEKKDFSHGRFNSLEYHPPYAVVILNNEMGAYSQKLLDYLYNRNISRIISMSTDKGSVLGDFDLLIGCQLFAKYLSEKLGFDMAKPNYPKEAMKIYKYSRGDLR